MILPPEDGCRNKLSRKSRAKAIERGQEEAEAAEAEATARREQVPKTERGAA